MDVVAKAEVDGEIPPDLPIILDEEIVRPSASEGRHRCKRAIRGVRYAQQEIGIWMSARCHSRNRGRRTVEAQAAEKVRIRVELLPIDTADVRSRFETVRAEQPRDLVLDLVAAVEEAGITPVDLRQPLQGGSRKSDLEDPADGRQTRGEADDPEGLNGLRAAEWAGRSDCCCTRGRPAVRSPSTRRKCAYTRT